MCVAYLKLHNIEISRKLADKRYVARSHEESTLNKSKRLKKISLKILLQSSFKLVAQIMTSNDNNTDNLKIHIKYYLNELNRADNLFKKIENSKKDKLV